MRARRALIGLVGIAALVAATWLLVKDRPTAPPSAPATKPVAASPRRPATAAPLEVPPYLAQSDAPERRIAGVVVKDGQPVPGAEVRLRARMVSVDEASDQVVASGPDGRFDFGVRPATLYLLSASLVGHVDATRAFNLADPKLAPPSDQLRLDLLPCRGSLYGQVRDASGGPIAGAKLRPNGIGGRQTNGEGAYELCLGPVRQVRIDADGFGSLMLLFDAARGRVKRDIVLIPEGILEVRLVRATDGQPVARAALLALPTEIGTERGAPAVGFSDERGEVRLGGMQAGRYRLWARAEGLAMTDAFQVTVIAGETTSGHVLRLGELARVTGTVVSNGKPVAGAVVTLVGKAAQVFWLPATTQADGRFALTSVTPGTAAVQVAGYRVKSPAEILAPATDVTIEVAAKATVRGRVLREGKPVVGAAVQTRAGQTISREEGRYELVGLEQGELELIAESEEAGAFTSITVELQEGEVRELDVELESGAIISGSVVDESGAPLPGVRVVWTHVRTGDVGHAMTDGAGNYVADSMTGKGMYRAQVFATAEASAPLLPAEGGHPQIRLDDGASRVEGVRLRVRNERRAIAGRVIDGAGAPIPDARVVALATRPGAEPVFTPWIAMPSARSDEDGAFSIADLAPGTYAVRAFAPGGSDGTVRDVHAGTSGVFVTIARAGSIRGRLVGFAAPPEVVVSALEAANKFVPAEVDGASFGVDGLSPGRYLVVAQMPGEGAAEVVDVRAGTPAELTLESKGAATIEATVTDFESGAPLPGFRCGTSARDGAHVPPPTWDPRGALVTDAQGRFVDARAPAGDFQVTCLGAGAYTTGLAVGSVPRGGRQAVRLKVLRRADGWKLTTTGILLDFQQAEPRVARVEPQSPAARADVRPGDLLHSVDGASLEGLGPEGVAVLLGRRAAGTQVTVALARAGQALTVTLPVVERE